MKTRHFILGLTLIFSAAVSMAEGSYNELYAKGIKDYKAKKYKDAVVTLKQAAALAKTPKQKYKSMYNYGMSLRNLKKFNEAEKVFEDLMKVENITASQKDSAFKYYLHNVYWQKKYKDVIAVAEKTYVDKNSSESMKFYCAYLAVLSSGNLKNYADKEAWAKKMAELKPEGIWNDSSLIYQAHALRSQKKYSAAIELLSDKTVSKMQAGKQTKAYSERALAKRSLKKYEEAIADFIKFYQLPKSSVKDKEVAIVYLIETYNMAGNTKDAMLWVEKLDTVKNKYWKTRGLMRHAQLLEKQGKFKEARNKWEECKKSGKWWKKQADNRIAAMNKKIKAEEE